MPSINVELFKGRSIEQKRQFVAAVTDAAVCHLGATPEMVRIRFLELKRDTWTWRPAPGDNTGGNSKGGTV